MKPFERSGRFVGFATGADEDGPAENVPHAALVSSKRSETDPVPDGAVQMSWTDDRGFFHSAHLVQWWRLDRQGLGKGVVVEVAVQARQRRDLAYPPHHVSAVLVVTGDPVDEARVLIGDPAHAGSWSYGVVFRGAILRSTSVAVAADAVPDGLIPPAPSCDPVDQGGVTVEAPDDSPFGPMEQW